jgi:broad specificity phosphatase PhoE
MPSELPRLFLARHGDTAWTDSRQRTGRTDLPLNESGEQRARQLGERLRRFSFARIFTSPLQRASKTCALAGFGEIAEVDPASVGVLGFEHNSRDEPIIALWNYVTHPRE